MNTKEAIKAIDNNWPPENYIMLREALELAKQALNKQIPKEAIEVVSRNNERLKNKVLLGRCPNCQAFISDGHEKANVCKCGQALIWREL